MVQENYITKVEFDRTINFTAVITGFKMYFDEMSSPTVVLAAKNTKKTSGIQNGSNYHA